MPENQPQYRLLTRSDFDGLVSALLLKEFGILGEVQFVHPKDVQDGKIEITSQDILTNLPYVRECHLCFDHHASEALRNEQIQHNHVLDPAAGSAARVVYDYHGGSYRFPDIDPSLIDAVDKADSADFTVDEILNPQGWTLLSFLMDPRTGLGRFRDFRISNYDLMMQLIDNCRRMPVEDILALPDVKERVDLYMSHQEPFRDQLTRCSTVHGNVVVLDLREEETIYCGNRFAIYALFPNCNASIHVIWGRNKQNTVLAIGKSIVNRTNTADIGELTLNYGGGGHAAAGTCQIDHDAAEQTLAGLIEQLQDPEAGETSARSYSAEPAMQST